MDDIEAKVRNIIGQYTGLTETQAAPLDRKLIDMGADSLDVVEILMMAEEEFGIAIPDDVERNWDISTVTIQDMVTAVRDHMGKKA